MVKSETCQGAETLVLKSEIETWVILDFETGRHTEKWDFICHHKAFQDFEIWSKVSETKDFPGTIHQPYLCINAVLSTVS